MVDSYNALTIANSVKDTLGWNEFRTSVVEHLRNQFRLVSFFGSPTTQPSFVNLNAVFAKNSHKLKLLRTTHEGDSFPSFTHDYPFFHCFEREIYEQFHIIPRDHPWLKPIRFSGDEVGKTSSYPFFKMQGKEIHEVGVGPIHAGVIEPGHFRFMCYGETIHHLEIQLGYQHRDLESLLLGKDPLLLAPLIETAAGDSSIAHAWAYCQALESLVGHLSEIETDLVRAVALELERVAMHLSGLAGISTDIAFLPGGSTYGRLRTAIINTSMAICGSRFGRGWIRPGGVRSGINQKLLDDVISTLEIFQKDFNTINQLFRSSATVKHRLSKTGTISKKLATDLGLVGPSARASGVSIDLRDNLKASPFSSHPIQPVSEQAGDCYARSIVRIREIEESTQWILAILKNSRGLNPPNSVLQSPGPDMGAMSVVEGWRGEVFHYFETGSDGKIGFYKIQDPSLRNWMAVAQSVRGEPISDFPICNKSFDLSYCGNDL